PQEEFPITFLKELTQLYYDLMALQVPNFHESLKESDLMENRTISLMSLFSKGGHAQQSSPVKSLLLRKVRQELQILTSRLQTAKTKDDLIKLIQLKSLEKSLIVKRKKITISGTLQDTIDYSLLASMSGGFGILGLIVTFLMLGSVCIVQMVMIGFVTTEIGGVLMICILMVLVFSYLRKKVYNNRR
ncbi:MAG: hypothetical protein ACFFKA_04980, partial [Candidatus Thorarchaeota archaeon]